MKYLDSAKNIYIQGIKGVGMANLAVILKQMGKNVTGSDIDEEFITDDVLAAHNIDVITDFEPKDLPENIDLYIYASAHNGSQNAQAKLAKERGVPVVFQTAILGELMQKFQNAIAVCGCHGKTTTSALMAYALEKLEVDPSFFIGTSTFQDKWAGEYDEQKYFVIEADEYGVDVPVDKTPKFMFLQPTHILCLNIDFDHPDIYRDVEATKKAFFQFFTKTPSTKLFFNRDNANLMDAVKALNQSSYTTFGFAKDADYFIAKPVIDEFNSDFELWHKGQKVGDFTISLFGMQNISNAAGVVIVLLSLGFTVEAVQKAIKNFSGVKRRFEKVAEVKDILVFDDYAHHPEEIEQTILSAKARFKDRRVIVIFQPHTFSRTEALKYDFIEALKIADYAILAPIFASARENNQNFTITSKRLVELAQERGINNIASYDDTKELRYLLTRELKANDIIFTMGAGDIYKMKNDIIEVAESVTSQGSEEL